MSKNSYPGINIQYPISQLILNRKKTVETRTYPIPKHYIGVPLALIETPGPRGEFRARIVGLITFGFSFRYLDSNSFYEDMNRHQVTPDSIWKWTDKKPKWGWPISEVIVFRRSGRAPQKRGIKYTKDVPLDLCDLF